MAASYSPEVGIVAYQRQRQPLEKATHNLFLKYPISCIPNPSVKSCLWLSIMSSNVWPLTIYWTEPVVHSHNLTAIKTCQFDAGLVTWSFYWYIPRILGVFQEIYILCWYSSKYWELLQSTKQLVHPQCTAPKWVPIWVPGSPWGPFSVFGSPKGPHFLPKVPIFPFSG